MSNILAERRRERELAETAERGRGSGYGGERCHHSLCNHFVIKKLGYPPTSLVPGSVLSDGSAATRKYINRTSTPHPRFPIVTITPLKNKSVKSLARKPNPRNSLVSEEVTATAKTEKAKAKVSSRCIIKQHSLQGQIVDQATIGGSRGTVITWEIYCSHSFSLPSGTSSMIPYFYPTYLLILCTRRETRDEARCSQKYKEVWAEYGKLYLRV